MSWFNLDELCLECEHAERGHPDYKLARYAERQAVIAGDPDFPGVGWPGLDGRVSPLWWLYKGGEEMPETEGEKDGL